MISQHWIRCRGQGCTLAEILQAFIHLSRCTYGIYSSAANAEERDIIVDRKRRLRTIP
jgi:hypothetical protein